MKAIPGASPKKILHYLHPTPNDGLYHTAILHVGVIDIFNKKSVTA